MALSGTGSAPNSGKGRARLTLRDPLIRSLLAGLGDYDLNELRAFCKKIAGARNPWDIARRRSGIFGTRRIRPDEACRVFKSALAGLKRTEGVQ